MYSAFPTSEGAVECHQEGVGAAMIQEGENPCRANRESPPRAVMVEGAIIVGKKGYRC